ncbi:MAG: TIGR00297 family protein [Methanoregula sp.]|nr:MAG: TIGR00297 family protein [Methanoregula sp.]
MERRHGLLLAAVLAFFTILIAPVLQPAWLMGLIVIFYSLVLFRFFETKYISFAFIVLAALYGLGLLPLFYFACTLAILVIGEIVFGTGADDLNTYLYYIISTSWAAVLVMVYLNRMVPLTIIFGIISAVLLKVILLKYEDSLVIEGVGIAMTMYLIDELNYKADLQMVVIAVIVAFMFGYFAFRFKTADLSGLFSAALVGIILIVFADARWFLIMLAFFIFGSFATKYKYSYKRKLGIEQGQGGARGYRNVFANGIAASAAAVLYGVFVRPEFIVLYVGCVATATADTLASEIGVTGGTPYMITTFKKVPIGTNGGITLTGELVSLLGGLAISLVALSLNVITPGMAAVCTVAGFVGTNIDSLVGATLENRGYVGNAGTNLLATIGGGIVAVGLYLLV